MFTLIIIACSQGCAILPLSFEGRPACETALIRVEARSASTRAVCVEGSK